MTTKDLREKIELILTKLVLRTDDLPEGVGITTYNIDVVKAIDAILSLITEETKKAVEKELQDLKIHQDYISQSESDKGVAATTSREMCNLFNSEIDKRIKSLKSKEVE